MDITMFICCIQFFLISFSILFSEYILREVSRIETKVKETRDGVSNLLVELNRQVDRFDDMNNDLRIKMDSIKGIPLGTPESKGQQQSWQYSWTVGDAPT